MSYCHLFTCEQNAITDRIYKCVQKRAMVVRNKAVEDYAHVEQLLQKFVDLAFK